MKDDKVYLNLTYVQEFTDLDAYITKDPYRIAIQYKFKNVKTVTVISLVQISIHHIQW